VQLANYKTGYDSDGVSPWAILRESQSLALNLPHTGQAITIDTGAPDDIHPRDKQTVGRRLALLALNKTYKQRAIAYRGPRFERYVKSGDKIIVQFASSTPVRLAGKNNNVVKGFTIAGKDKVFYPAHAVLSGNKVTLRSAQVVAPIAARYAWEDNPEHANIADKNGLPAEPFRTDNW
jgi:sialate O-acetylesterase